ncbi:MAG: hypothetical protein NXI04_14780 [Planctomycetaceae bacterium]|nr:hypothetical protein [Planctomycetaceae bacterium]
MSQFNLSSRSSISSGCDLSDLRSWWENELLQIQSFAVRSVVRDVCVELDSFICFSEQPLLLWEGCDRRTPEGKRQRTHKYPDELKRLAKERKVKLDTRPNGPAIAAFLLAGGCRPEREGSTNAWSVHHLYSGKFPYVNRETTLHASKSPTHFSQSAGLVAAHPIADAICDEIPFFSWLLRAHSFLRFGYDPDGVFSADTDDYGFRSGTACELIFREPVANLAQHEALESSIGNLKSH